MAVKKIVLPSIGEVTLVKSSRSRSIRLSVTANGVRVSMPTWTPYSAGSAFAVSHTAWIQSELSKQQTDFIEAGQRIGKLHYVRFEHILGSQAITNRVTGTEVVVRLHAHEQSTDASVQQRAVKAAARALKREAELLLPPRLQHLAQKHHLSYESVSAKSLKRRWGSCSSNRDITFNIYLMELPWEYIDYVICHELAHTKHMNHGPDFWQLLIRMEPRARDISKRLRKHQPLVGNDAP